MKSVTFQNNPWDSKHILQKYSFTTGLPWDVNDSWTSPVFVATAKCIFNKKCLQLEKGTGTHLCWAGGTQSTLVRQKLQDLPQKKLKLRFSQLAQQIQGGGWMSGMSGVHPPPMVTMVSERPLQECCQYWCPAQGRAWRIDHERLKLWDDLLRWRCVRRLTSGTSR